MAALFLESALSLFSKRQTPISHERVPEEVADAIVQKAAIDYLLQQGRESTFTASGIVKPKDPNVLASTIKDANGKTLLYIDATHIYDSKLLGPNGDEHVNARITDVNHNLVATVDSMILRQPGSKAAQIFVDENDAKNQTMAKIIATTSGDSSIKVENYASAGFVGTTYGAGQVEPITARTATERDRQIYINTEIPNHGTQTCTTKSQYWQIQQELGLRPLQNTDTTCMLIPNNK